MGTLHLVADWLADPTNCLALFGALTGGLGLYLQWRGNHRKLKAHFRVEAPLDALRYEPYLVCEIINLSVPVTITSLLQSNTRDWGVMTNLVHPKLPKRLERFETVSLRMSGSGYWNSQKGASLQSIFFKTECGLFLSATRKTVREWNIAVRNMVDGTPPDVWLFMRSAVQHDGKPLPPLDPNWMQAEDS